MESVMTNKSFRQNFLKFYVSFYRRRFQDLLMLDIDLMESKELVSKLSLPESTKSFVYAIKVPEHDSTVYILSTQNLSQRSSSDVESLIRQLRPDAVVVQRNKDSAFGVSQGEEASVLKFLKQCFGFKVEEEEVPLPHDVEIPTSTFEVLKQCFVDKYSTKEKFESVAENFVLNEIFGTGFNAHLTTAERVAREVGSSFTVLESPLVTQNVTRLNKLENYRGGSALISSKRFTITDDARRLMLKLLSSHITQLGKEVIKANVESEFDPYDEELPPFAQSIYAMLVDLRDIFDRDLPVIKKALASARKTLSNVTKGEPLDVDALSEARLFQIAIEGLRIGFNNAGRVRVPFTGQVEFSKLSHSEKSYALMADQLRSQAKKYKNVVAVVEASNLEGLRRNWNIHVPQQVRDMSTSESFLNLEPVGMHHMVGSSPLSKALLAYPFLKILALKTPSPIWTYKAMTNKKKAAYPSQEDEGTGFDSPEVIKAATEITVLYATDAGLSVMGAALYAVMVRRRVSVLPLAMFGAGLATVAGLVMYEEGIERAAVCLPSATRIARLGRGIQNLREASSQERLGERLKNLKLHCWPILRGSLSF